MVSPKPLCHPICSKCRLGRRSIPNDKPRPHKVAVEHNPKVQYNGRTPNYPIPEFSITVIATLLLTLPFGCSTNEAPKPDKPAAEVEAPAEEQAAPEPEATAPEAPKTAPPLSMPSPEELASLRTAELNRLRAVTPRESSPIGLTSVELVPGLDALLLLKAAPTDEESFVLDVAQETGALMSRMEGGSAEAIPKPWGTREIAYEISSLLVYELKDNHIKVLPADNNQKGWWIDVADLGEQHLFSWTGFLASRNDVLWPEKFEEQQLYAAPSGSEGSQPLAEGYYELTPTGRFSEERIEVRLVEYKADFLCGGEGTPTGRHLDGWLDVIDENGQPTLWYHTRGC